MRRILRLRPSPAMVIAVIALIAALGGTSIAAGPLAGTAAKKSRVIDGKRLKGHSITRSKIKKNTLTGTEISEAKLGTVPNATNAVKAKTADTATSLSGKSATDFAAASRFVSFGPVELADDERRDLAKVGPFTFSARCQIDEGGQDTATVYIASSVDHSAYDTGGSFTNTDFGPATDENERQWAVQNNGATGDKALNSYAGPGAAIAPDGTQVTAASFWQGLNLFGHPAGHCQFGGSLQVG